MENKENEFELVPVYNKETGAYAIKNFENCRSIVANYIADCHVDLAITNADDYKLVKATRADVRKKIDTISNARKQIKKMLVGEFEKQLKELETMLGDADDKLTERVSAWEIESTNKVARPHKITLAVKGYDMKKIEKVEEFAKKQGLEAKIE